MRVAKIISFVVLVVLLAWWIVGTSEAFEGFIHGHKHSKTYKALYESLSVISHAIVRIRLNIAGIAYFTHENDGALTVFGTIIIAFFTFTLWRSTDKLWVAGESNSERQLRAYVCAKDVKYAEVGDVRTFHFVYENGGQTPAKNLVASINYEIFENDIPEDFDFPDAIGQDYIESISVLGPHSTFDTALINLDARVINDINAPFRKIYMWGWVEYNDVFNGTPRHRSEFCCRITIHKKSTKSDMFTITFPPHGRFNAIDGDCLRSPRT